GRAGAGEWAGERLLDLRLRRRVPPPPTRSAAGGRPIQLPSSMENPPPPETATRDKLREMLRAGKLDDREVEVDVAEPQHGVFEVFSAPGMDQIGFDVGKLQSLFGGRGGGQHRRRKVKIPQALELLTGEEAGQPIQQGHGRP